MRHATHWDGITLFFVPGSQGNLQFTRANHCIVKEEFIKIAQPEEKERTGMLRFQLLILPNHWSGVTSCHAFKGEKFAIKAGLIPLACESEEAYIVSKRGASAMNSC